MSRALLAVVALAAAAALSLPATARADGVTIAAVCNGSGCSTGWYRTSVTVSFNVSGTNIKSLDCPETTIDSDTAGQDVKCVVTLSDNTITGKVVTIKRDATPPTVSSIGASRPADSNGWYNHGVTITASGSDALSGIASCTSTTYSGPDGSSITLSGTCTDQAGNVSAPKTISFSYDSTGPSVSPAPAREPDANGWYDHPLDVAFQGQDGASGVDGCTSASYSGPDNAGATVSGTCRDKAGNSTTVSFGLHYDATPPAVTTATPSRPPDDNGWYNHDLSVAFGGTDSTSGIASCDTVTYAKPDDATASVTGRCRDNAGNASAPGVFAFRFDSTPPKLAKLAAQPDDREVSLAWTASPDTARIEVARTRAGGKTVTLYAGKRLAAFVDRKVRNGSRYTYVVTALDAAGNRMVVKAVATPAAALVAPRRDQRIRGETTLRWRGVKGASYYNVQLWLRGKKVLTAWPSGPSLRLPRLASGPYTWFVWPGRGSRNAHRYGPLIGHSTFVVRP